jgi:hypothetical protein
MSYHGPEWDSEMVCAEYGLSYVSTRYVEVESGRMVKSCPEYRVERRASQEVVEQ